jgi:hypothetical protein
MIGQFGSLYGVRFIEDHNLVIKYQFRWPRSKRRRIRQKWEKQEYNFKYKPDMSYYQTGSGAFIGHPAAIAVLRKNLDSMNKTRESKNYNSFGFNSFHF